MACDLLSFSMVVRILLPICVAIGILLGIIAVIVSSQTPPVPPVPFAPPTPPFDNYIATVGVVEPSSRNIFIGTPIGEIVEKVFVASGDFVKEGEPLFELNTLLLRTKLAEAKAGYAVALSEYKKQLALPRPEEIPPAKQRVKAAEANYLNHLSQYDMVENIENPKAVSRDEYNQKKYKALQTKYLLKESEEEFNLLMAGAWIRDLDIYRAEKQRARAAVQVIEDQIYRSTIRAPITGMVLKVYARVGEYAPVGELAEPLMIFGAVEPLNIQVDIDEEEVWRVIKGAPGVAFVRGNSHLSVKLKYLRVIPFLVPKQVLSGGGSELVDTRVLQVLYELESHDLPIYPGELMDIYLEAHSNEAAR